MDSALNDAVHIDGSHGEGGGQMLRSALSLSMLDGRPVRIHNIRAGRAKPGLMRQHLVAVQAAQQVCAAEVRGAEIGSTALDFVPATVRPGDYQFAIGTAGSTMLVLQTLLPALLVADAPSTLRIEGGTHNTMAPSSDFIARAFLPLLARIGAQIGLHVERLGFYPAGGGAVTVSVQPAPLQALHVLQRGALRSLEARALVLGLPRQIAQRELDVVGQRLALRRDQLYLDAPSQRGGTGNAVHLIMCHEQIDEVFTALGERGVSAEIVAGRACDELIGYLSHDAPVGEHLADQLLLPMLVAGGGSFVTSTPSSHLRSNAAVIEAFGMARIAIEALPGRASAHLVRVTPTPRTPRDDRGPDRR